MSVAEFSKQAPVKQAPMGFWPLRHVQSVKLELRLVEERPP